MFPLFNYCINMAFIHCQAHQQDNFQHRSETLPHTHAGVVVYHHKLNVLSHQTISIVKAAQWRLLFEYQGVASL